MSTRVCAWMHVYADLVNGVLPHQIRKKGHKSAVCAYSVLISPLLFYSNTMTFTRDPNTYEQPCCCALQTLLKVHESIEIHLTC